MTFYVACTLKVVYVFDLGNIVLIFLNLKLGFLKEMS